MTLEDAIETPALVYDEATLASDLEAARAIADRGGCRLLFSLKACYLPPILERITRIVDGFSCSSLFEVLLAREIESDKIIHVTSPAIRSNEATEIGAGATHLSFNSLGQWASLRRRMSKGTSCGIRVNPLRQMGIDARYDPCRPFSHLGVTMATLTLAASKSVLEGVEGLHFHTNCESDDFGQMRETLQIIADGMPRLLEQVQWLNLGGGYLAHAAASVESFAALARDVSSSFNVELMFEPGAAIVGRSGSLLTTVIDIVEAQGRQVAIVDSTIHHLADILDFEYTPTVLESRSDGGHSFIVAGRSCLAGDIFGTYAFDEPLQVGSRLTFDDAGAYTLSKATTFNGINLPRVYLRTQDGAVHTIASWAYEDFRRIAGSR